MFAFPIEVQVYLLGMMLGLAVPFVLFWLLHRPLRDFLREIFHSPEIEQFWMRVVLVGFLASTLSVGVVFQPAAASKLDEVALFFDIADKFKHMLDSLLSAMFAIFLPLLAAYTILHIPRRGDGRADTKVP